MNTLSLLIKPASSACNMSCRYCFYHATAKSRDWGNRGLMSLSTAESIIKKAFAAQPKRLEIAFQGGEPMLVGIDFFNGFTALADRYNVKKIPVAYALQTNGTLITKEWCDFFKRHNFLLGVSLDGDRQTHDFLRKSGDSGSYLAVRKNIRLLEESGVEFNILTVVTKHIAKHGERIYKNLKKEGFKFLQFILCLSNFDQYHRQYAPTAEEYGLFLQKLYALWQRDYLSGSYVSIRQFENIVNAANGMPVELCSMSGRCKIQLVIESDGSVYPCDFYCADGYELGNIDQSDFISMENGNAAQSFLSGEEQSKECIECKYFALCGGGCRRERVQGRSAYCQSYKMLFKTILKDAP